MKKALLAFVLLGVFVAAAFQPPEGVPKVHMAVKASIEEGAVHDMVTTAQKIVQNEADAYFDFAKKDEEGGDH